MQLSSLVGAHNASLRSAGTFGHLDFPPNFSHSSSLASWGGGSAYRGSSGFSFEAAVDLPALDMPYPEINQHVTDAEVVLPKAVLPRTDSKYAPRGQTATCPPLWSAAPTLTGCEQFRISDGRRHTAMLSPPKHQTIMCLFVSHAATSQVHAAPTCLPLRYPRQAISHDKRSKTSRLDRASRW